MSRSIRPQVFVSRIIGGLLLVWLAGCSAIKIGYNNAPSLAYWWLDSYIDFDEAQTRQVRDDLDVLHAWHRKTELPAYAAMLRQMQRLAPGNVSPAQVCQLLALTRAHLQRLGEQSERTLSAVTPTLKPQQLQHLALQFDKRNQKWREKWLDGTPAERSERRLKQAAERAETLYGRLDEAQLAVLRNGLATSSFDANRSYREVLRRQQDILKTLKEHSSEPARSAHVKAETLALINRSLNSPDPAYRSYFEQMLAESCRTLAALHNSTSPAQRENALNQLRDYEEDVRTLALQVP